VAKRQEDGTPDLRGLIDFTYSDGEVSKTIKLAAPIVEDGRELSHPLEDYFPNKDPWRWFEEMNARSRREWIVGGLMGGACPIFGYPKEADGESVELHHEYRKGMGGRIEAEAPWAMIPGLKSPNYKRSAHDLYHQLTIEHKGFELVHWDPLDEVAGLVVLDEAGERIPDDDLWFYSRPTDERVTAALNWKGAVLDMAATHTRSAYTLGELSSIGLSYAKLLGYETVESLFASLGIGNDAPHLGRMLKEQRAEAFEDLRAGCVIIEAADLWRKKLAKQEPEDVTKWLEMLHDMCSPGSAHPSFAAYASLIRRRFSSGAREFKVVIITGEDFEVTETTSEDPESLVLAGQTVISGHVVKVQAVEPADPSEPNLLDPEEEKV
jgi:hypothetical protein